MNSIAEKLAGQITGVQRWTGPTVVLITFSDGSQAGFDANNDKRPMPTGDSNSAANELARNTKTIRSGRHGPEIVFLDGSWIIFEGRNWMPMQAAS